MEEKPSKKKDYTFLDVKTCPYCNSTEFKRDGIRHDKQRFRCKNCRRTFTAITGTILANTKKSQKKWEDFVIQFTNDATLIASHEYSSINKNTAHLWRIKMMRCLGEIVSSTILNGNVWIDEIYFDVSKKDMITNDKGLLLHGISRNKIAVEVAIDENNNTYAVVMGIGKPTSEMIIDTLKGHIRSGSTIIHDNFHGHQEYLKMMQLENISIGSGKPGYFKLMQTANQFCALIKRVFVLHVGISRNHIQDYLNWACLRQHLCSIKPRERKDYILKLCASTKISYKMSRKKSSAHRI